MTFRTAAFQLLFTPSNFGQDCVKSLDHAQTTQLICDFPAHTIPRQNPRCDFKLLQWQEKNVALDFAKPLQGFHDKKKSVRVHPVTGPGGFSTDPESGTLEPIQPLTAGHCSARLEPGSTSTHCSLALTPTTPALRYSIRNSGLPEVSTATV